MVRDAKMTNPVSSNPKVHHWWMQGGIVVSAVQRSGALLYATTRMSLKTCQVKETGYKRLHTMWFHLRGLSIVGKSVETKENSGCMGLGGAGGIEEYLLKGTRLLLGVTKCIKMDRGHGCTALWMCWSSLSCALEMGELYSMSACLSKAVIRSVQWALAGVA